MDQKMFSLQRLVLKQKRPSFSRIQNPLVLQRARVIISPTTLIYTHTNILASVYGRKVFIKLCIYVQMVKKKFKVSTSLYFQQTHRLSEHYMFIGMWSFSRQLLVQQNQTVNQ
ncbi:Hypothetical_protein [Hexamita inflata]|uniref:Hypothetical_protein n=1 Tax=Hexamita inflata TaxID=28002 RepID=A0ABP1HYD7_9EUKA